MLSLLLSVVTVVTVVTLCFSLRLQSYVLYINNLNPKNKHVTIVTQNLTTQQKTDRKRKNYRHHHQETSVNKSAIVAL